MAADKTKIDYAQRPVLEALRRQAVRALEPLAGVQDEHEEQPAEEEKTPPLRVTEMTLVRVEEIVSFFWYACKAKHGAPSLYHWSVRTS